MAEPRRCISVIFLLFSCLEQATAILNNLEGWPRGQTTGVFYDWGSTEGYNFFASAWGINTLITDNRGRVLHEWQEPDGFELGGLAYLTEEGTLLRNVRSTDFTFFEDYERIGGLLREYNKEGNCIWEFVFQSGIYRLKGDFVILPNGNVLASALQLNGISRAIENGYKGEGSDSPPGYWSNVIVEIPRNTGYINPLYDPDSLFDKIPLNTCMTFSIEDQIVWSWDSFDHSSGLYLSPGTWDINKEFDINGMDYLPSRDHIIFICEPCGEVFIIDHGIKASKVRFAVGNFMYRWGNPGNYGRLGEQMLNATNVKWLRDNFGWKYNVEGAVLVFNNHEANQTASSFVQFRPPFVRGRYFIHSDGTFGPRDFDFKIMKIQEKLWYWDKFADEIEEAREQATEEEAVEEEEIVAEEGEGVVEEEEMTVEEEEMTVEEAEEEEMTVEEEEIAAEEEGFENKTITNDETSEENLSEEINEKLEKNKEKERGRLLSFRNFKNHPNYRNDGNAAKIDSRSYPKITRNFYDDDEVRQFSQDNNFGKVINYEDFDSLDSIQDYNENRIFGNFEGIPNDQGLETLRNFGTYGNYPNVGYGNLKNAKINAFVYPWRSTYSKSLGGIQRLPNGNFILTSSFEGEALELRLYDRAVWKYVNPYMSRVKIDNLRGPDCKLEYKAEIPFCDEFDSPCNAIGTFIKYSKQFKGFKALFSLENE